MRSQFAARFDQAGNHDAQQPRRGIEALRITTYPKEVFHHAGRQIRAATYQVCHPKGRFEQGKVADVAIAETQVSLDEPPCCIEMTIALAALATGRGLPA